MHTLVHLLFKLLCVSEQACFLFPLEALGESLGKGDDHKDMDIITKFLKVSAVGKGRRPLRMCRKLSYTGEYPGEGTSPAFVLAM